MENNSCTGCESKFLEAIALFKEYENSQNIFQPKYVAYEPSMKLGTGMNITGDKKSIALESESIEVLCDSINTSIQEITTNTQESAKVVSNTLNFDISLFFSLRASGGFNFLNDMTKKEKSVFATYIHTCKANKSQCLSVDLKFRPKVLEFLQKHGFTTFYKQFGTHYISEIFNYASFFGQVEIKTETLEEKKEAEHFLTKLKFSKPEVNIGVNGKHKTEDKDTNKKFKMNSKIQTTGVPIKEKVSD